MKREIEKLEQKEKFTEEHLKKISIAASVFLEIILSVISMAEKVNIMDQIKHYKN